MPGYARISPGVTEDILKNCSESTAALRRKRTLANRPWFILPARRPHNGVEGAFPGGNACLRSGDLVKSESGGSFDTAWAVFATRMCGCVVHNLWAAAHSAENF